MNNFYHYFKTVCLLLVSLVAFIAVISPERVGEWEAQRDIAYDRVWMEWVGDCDCTEPLE
jgi:hypothetical protein